MSKERRFEELYQQHQSKVKRLVLGYVKGNEAIAKDLLQDIFIKIWNNLDGFRGEANISTWIYRITVNTCLMFLRSKKALTLFETTFQDEPDNTDITEEQFRAMHRCIDTLNATNRSIILLELQDVPQEEIAEILGMKHEAIRTRIFRIKNKLSKCVKNG